jgi:hypothetical protein
MSRISFRVPKEESPSPKNLKPVAGDHVKVEPGTVKIEPDTIKVEPDVVKLEPTSPEPSEAWRAKYIVPSVYRSEEDGDWAGWLAAVCLSAKEAGVVVIDSDDDGDDDDDGGETGFETGGKDSKEEDTALDFSTFDY